MKKFTRSMNRFLLLLTLACVALDSVYAQGLPATVISAFDRANVPIDSVGVVVQQVVDPGEDESTLLDWQSHLSMSPASTMKLVTSYAALDTLGPAYTWKTSVYKSGHMAGDTLVGDLIIQGGGDPHLVLENFWILLNQIRDKGIHQIQGNLIIDTSWMEPQSFDSADFDGDPTRPYNVGPNALLVNYNVIDLQLKQSGDGLQVDVTTPIALNVSTDVKIMRGPCSEWRSGLVPSFSLVDQQIHMNLTGTYPAGCGAQHWYLQPYPLTHEQYVGALFREMWRQMGGKFTGEVHSGVVPASAELVTEFRSAPMSDVLRDMNKFSNNVMTRLVLLTLDKEASHQAANAQRASQWVLQWLATQGVDNRDIILENGSGLSRGEQISPYQMATMLKRAFASRVMPEIMASMPVLGVDGTMKNRAKNLTVAGHAHIKSGTIDGVRNFAGYLLAASGKRYVVVCFVNHKNAKLSDAAEDMLLQWIYDNG